MDMCEMRPTSTWCLQQAELTVLSSALFLDQNILLLQLVCRNIFFSIHESTNCLKDVNSNVQNSLQSVKHKFKQLVKVRYFITHYAQALNTKYHFLIKLLEVEK